MICIILKELAARRVLFKQRDNRFYPPSAWSLAMMLVRVPFQLVEAFIFAGIIYFWVGKTPDKFDQPQCLSDMLSDIVLCSGVAAAQCTPRFSVDASMGHGLIACCTVQPEDAS